MFQKLWRFIFINALMTNLIIVAFPAQAFDQCSSINILYNQPLDYQDWYERDRFVSEQKVKNNLYSVSGLISEWEKINQGLEDSLAGAYFDEEGRFRIYSTECSGKIHVLGLAQYYREQLLCDLISGLKNSRPYPGFLNGTYPAGFPAMDQTGFTRYRTVYQTALPDLVISLKSSMIVTRDLHGLTVYMLPFHIKGYRAMTYSRQLPGREEAIYVSAFDYKPALSAIMAHELGHCILLQYPRVLLRANPPQKYNQAAYGSAYYQINDEQYAECFRMLLGSEKSKDEMAVSCNNTGLLNDYSLADALVENTRRELARGDQLFYDLERMHITFRGAKGNIRSVLVGCRPEQLHSIVCTGPEIVFNSPLIGDYDEGFAAQGILYHEGKPGETRQLPINVSNGVASLRLFLPEEGVYKLIIGQSHIGTVPINGMAFQIIYVK